MTDPMAELERKMAALRATYAQQLPGKVKALADAAAVLLAAGADFTPAAAAVRAQAHKLAGSAGTFGFTALGEIASGLELLCDSLIEAGQRPTAEHGATIQQHVDAILGQTLMPQEEDAFSA